MADGKSLAFIVFKDDLSRIGLSVSILMKQIGLVAKMDEKEQSSSIDYHTTLT